MSRNGSISLLFVANLLLMLSLAEANNALGRLGLSVHLDSLLVLFFGLYLKSSLGLIFVLLLGFLNEALHPVPEGTYVLGYLLLWGYLVWWQNRIRLQNPAHIRVVAFSAQLLWMAALSVLFWDGHLPYGVYGLRILLDTLLSALLVLGLAWPWCAFQRRLLLSLGWNLDAQPAPR